MRLIFSWPSQAFAIFASMYLSMQIPALLFLAGVAPLSLTLQFLNAPLLLYCILNFGIPMAVLLCAILSSETRNTRIVLAENGIAIRYLKNWKTQNLVLLLVYLVTFVILRIVADLNIAAFFEALES